jgi:hypothetical protein
MNRRKSVKLVFFSLRIRFREEYGGCQRLLGKAASSEPILRAARFISIAWNIHLDNIGLFLFQRLF